MVTEEAENVNGAAICDATTGVDVWKCRRWQAQAHSVGAMAVLPPATTEETFAAIRQDEAALRPQTDHAFPGQH